MVVESFGRFITTVFEQKMKSSLLAGSWSILAMFLKYQPYGLDDIAHIGPFHRVKWLQKISFESYGVFERTSIWFRMTAENFVRFVST